MAKFKVGDVVIGNEKASEHYRVTKMGAKCIVTKTYDDGNIKVKYKGHKYVVWLGFFDPVSTDEITITRHGDKVVAKYGKKVGVAKCSPDDTFDFAVGAKLAFSRLMGEPEDKPEPKRKFKLGEFVKVIDKTNPLHNFPLGSIVAIMDLKDDKAVCYGLATKFGRYSFCRQTLSLNDLEPLSENTHAD